MREAASCGPSAFADIVFSERCNIYISRLCYDVSVRLSVRLSVTEVHWRIIANLGFKFRSHTSPRMAAACSSSTAAVLLAVLLAGGSSRAMLASARSLVNFGDPIHISGMAEARAVKFCTQGNYIKSCQMDDKSPSKGAWLRSRYAFLYAQLWTLKISPRPAVK